ncbi:MAG: zinc ABC transporter substrate-binding protein [Candidatus Bathyarchaeia archaeon]|nr:metal ABC transporter substrate-binding protein [Candidatus Bathyarchaeota archaeon]
MNWRREGCASLILALALLQAAPIRCMANAEPQEGTVKVAVSIGSLSLLVAAAGGSHVLTVELVPQGMDPHEFSITPEAVMSASQASLVVVTGHIGWEDKLLEEVAERRGRTVGEVGLSLLKDLRGSLILLELPSGRGGGGGVNLHGFWLHPDNAKVIVEAVASKLSLIDPENAGDYLRNSMAFSNRVELLKNMLRGVSEAHGLSGKRIVAGSPAEQYVAAALYLETAVVLGGEEGEARPTALSEAYEGLAEGRYAMILVSDVAAMLPIYASFEELSSETGAPIATVRILSFESFPDYFALMAYNAGRISGIRPANPRGGSANGGILWPVIASTAGVLALVEALIIWRGRLWSTRWRRRS